MFLSFAVVPFSTSKFSLSNSCSVGSERAICSIISITLYNSFHFGLMEAIIRHCLCWISSSWLQNNAWLTFGKLKIGYSGCNLQTNEPKHALVPFFFFLGMGLGAGTVEVMWRAWGVDNVEGHEKERVMQSSQHAVLVAAEMVIGLEEVGENEFKEKGKLKIYFHLLIWTAVILYYGWERMRIKRKRVSQALYFLQIFSIVVISGLYYFVLNYVIIEGRTQCTNLPFCGV